MSSLVSEVRVINVEEKLRSDAMKGKWSVVFETCKQERALWTAKITGMGDPVLHMAVSNAKEKVVVDMVDFLVEQEKSLAQNNVVVIVDGDGEERWNANTVLSAEDDRKNTPLHLAAIRGNVKICKKISGIKTSLIARPNIAGETPLFLAALNGWKEAFLWLHYLYVGSHEVSSIDLAQCIRDKNDNTILHCAIAEGHADVAIEIIHLYKDHLKEMMKRNKEGLSPLHLLAAKRTAFKSTALFGLAFLAPAIYWLSIAEEKNQATTLRELQAKKSKCGLVVWNFEELWKLTKKNHVATLEKLQGKIKSYEQSILGKFMKWICIILMLPIWLLTCLVFSLWLFLAAFMGFLEVVLAVFMLLTLSEGAIRRWFLLLAVPQMKKGHTWWHQIMTKLLQHASQEDMSQIILRNTSQQLSISLQTEEDKGKKIHENSKNWWIEVESMATPTSGTITVDTPLMIATENGAIEMMEAILELFPSTIKDVNIEGKNIFLLAIEYRQTDAYNLLCEQKWLKEGLFRQVDKEGNNALHLAGRLRVKPNYSGIPIWEALSLLREIRWFNSVEKSIPRGLSCRYNRKMETPTDILRKSRKELVKIEEEWVANTSQACSVVSTLVVSVAFATRTSIPGDYDDKGYAILRNKPQAFKTFKDSSFVALLFSLISTICFVSTVASPSQKYFHTERFIPSRFYCGVYFMFASIVCLWISFCAGDFFLLDDNNKKLHKALPTYILLSSGFILMVVSQLPGFLQHKYFGIYRTPAPRLHDICPIQYRRTENKENGPDLNHKKLSPSLVLFKQHLPSRSLSF